VTFSAVETRKLGRVYGRRRVLHEVSLTMRAGEALALLGPNGAGKSTLVGILSTLARPSSGEVAYDGQKADANVRRGIGLVAHDSLVYGDLTGEENLKFFARAYGVTADVAALLRRVGLDAEAAARPARTYSRGMLQRLSLARALVHQPRLLLLDEPFTGLDRGGSALLAGILSEERARGAILLIVTHDLDAVATVVDRVVVLDRGRVTHDAPAPVSCSGAALAEIYRGAVRGAA
jgi:heme exporter protein A